MPPHPSLKTSDNMLEIFSIENWHGPFSSEIQNQVITALEDGKVIVFEGLTFAVRPEEIKFLAPTISGNDRKNISLDPKSRKISNVTLDEQGSKGLAEMMDRFGSNALGFLKDLLPAYASSLERARTSYRPTEIEGRSYSPRHDDKRLHVDAFPSRPLYGRRILRFFTNIAGDGAMRHWRVGEPFGIFAQKFMPHIRSPWPGSSWLFDRIGITKGKRSLYDHYMLQLHDGAKLDDRYQSQVSKADVFFKSGTSWFCYTDQVLHAAISGHAALEQTFHLPANAMADPSKAPLRILEKMLGRALV